MDLFVNSLPDMNSDSVGYNTHRIRPEQDSDFCDQILSVTTVWYR